MKDSNKKILIIGIIVLVVCAGLYFTIAQSIDQTKDDQIIREGAKELCLERGGISDIRVGYNYCVINNTKYEIKGKVRYDELQYLYLDQPKRAFLGSE